MTLDKAATDLSITPVRELTVESRSLSLADEAAGPLFPDVIVTHLQRNDMSAIGGTTTAKKGKVVLPLDEGMLARQSESRHEDRNKSKDGRVGKKLNSLPPL